MAEAEEPVPDVQQVIEQIRQAFRDTEHPGDAFLQGSQEGCEPAEVTAPFKGVTHWTQADPAILEPNYTALSFFSEGGFRHFLPAFLIADLQDRLQTADPVFHLTNGFSDKVVKLPAGSRVYEKTIGKSAFVNPRRYGAMTWQDHARGRLSIFAREEADAIVAYLEYKRDADPHGFIRDEIDAALDGLWRDRANQAPTQEALRQYLQAENEYFKTLERRGCPCRKESMAMYQWTTTKPTEPGWYWFRGEAHEADPFIVQIDEAGQFQWPDGGFQEVKLAKGEWAGPIEEPKET